MHNIYHNESERSFLSLSASGTDGTTVEVQLDGGKASFGASSPLRGALLYYSSVQLQFTKAEALSLQFSLFRLSKPDFLLISNDTIKSSPSKCVAKA